MELEVARVNKRDYGRLAHATLQSKYKVVLKFKESPEVLQKSLAYLYLLMYRSTA